MSPVSVNTAISQTITVTFRFDQEVLGEKGLLI